MESSRDARMPFGRYLLLERIGHGGMGQVFRAVAVGADGFEKPVVIKRLLPQLASSTEMAAMFANEARVMTRLAHPNIVQVIDFGRGDQDDYFLVMELVDGVDLGRFCEASEERGEPVPISMALFVTLQVLRGLRFVHTEGAGIVHRDVSPGNVLLSRLGEVKVADFGVASATEAAAGSSVVGKPHYIAPEQYRGEPVDARADLFSVGVLLFRTLTGRFPFEADAPDRVQEAIAAGRPLSLQQVRPELPSALDEVLGRALQADPNDRFDSAQSMAAALGDIGVTPADADDLAEAVTLAAESTGRGRRVLALGARNEGELTRTGPGGEFTVRLTAPGSEEAPAPPKPTTPARGWGRWALFAAAPLALVAGVAATSGPSKPQPVASASSQPNAAPSAKPRPSAPAPRVGRPPASGTPVPTARVERPSRGVASRPSGAITPPAASVSPPLPEPSCVGAVHFYSRGSWTVTGGPRPAQAPGRYQWPCGNYQLRATSRLDEGQTRSTLVRISEGRAAVFDLR